MRTVIFIRSFRKDFEYLSFCLRSIQKYARGFDEIVVVVPEGHEKELQHLTAERVTTTHDGHPGYLAQQDTKVHADTYAPHADFLVHIDSDCVFTQPVTPETFMREGKPLWLVTPWTHMSADDKRSWYHVMCKCVQDCPPYEMMRRHGICLPRWSYKAFRDFIQKTHGITATEYIMSQPAHEFSEFNCLGFYLWLHHRDKFSWWNTAEEGVPPTVLDQYWSHEPMSDETRRKLTNALA